MIDMPADLRDLIGRNPQFRGPKRSDMRWEEPRIKRQKPADRKLDFHNYRRKVWDEDFDWVE